MNEYLSGVILRSLDDQVDGLNPDPIDPAGVAIPPEGVPVSYDFARTGRASKMGWAKVELVDGALVATIELRLEEIGNRELMDERPLPYGAVGVMVHDEVKGDHGRLITASELFGVGLTHHPLDTGAERLKGVSR